MTVGVGGVGECTYPGCVELCCDGKSRAKINMSNWGVLSLSYM